MIRRVSAGDREWSGELPRARKRGRRFFARPKRWKPGAGLFMAIYLPVVFALWWASGAYDWIGRMQEVMG